VVDKRKTRLNDRGSTLVEIVVSVLIIGIIFVPLLMGLSNALKANARAEMDLNAEGAGVNVLETVKALGYSGIKTATGDDFNP